MNHKYTIPTTTVRASRKITIMGIVPVILLMTFARHMWYLSFWHDYRLVTILWTISFLAIGIQWFLSWLERPYTVTGRQQRYLDSLRVSIAIPVYNEAPELLDRTIYSLFAQTRLPNRIEIVDDGSEVDYTEACRYWENYSSSLVEFAWVRQVNAGKKAAHARAFRDDIEADIFITVDSDTALERTAIEEGLKPFADRRVQSVAGIELAWNHAQNLLVRLKSVNTLVWQFITCSAQSVAGGNVLVNRGTFALYRASLITTTLEAYTGETFFGHRVMLGDDSMLTTFALGRGRAVQQPTAVCFSMYPETFSHTLRQWARWMRGSTVRNFWRIRYLPILSWGWWFTVLPTWWFFSFMAVVATLAVDWRQAHVFVLTMLYIGALWSWIVASRMHAVRRSDQNWTDRLDAFLLVPLAMAWMTFVLRPIRIYGMATCLRQGWGTRQGKAETLS
jgi:hyaluronan synthase